MVLLHLKMHCNWLPICFGGVCNHKINLILNGYLVIFNNFKLWCSINALAITHCFMKTVFFFNLDFLLDFIKVNETALLMFYLNSECF